MENKLQVKLGIFGAVPILLLQDKRVKPNGIKCYIALSSFQGTKDNSYPSQQEIAKRGGMTIQAVIEGLKNLELTGWISKKRRGLKKTNIYDCLNYVEPIEEFNKVDKRKKNSFSLTSENSGYQKRSEFKKSEKIRVQEVGKDPSSYIKRPLVKDQQENTPLFPSTKKEGSARKIKELKKKEFPPIDQKVNTPCQKEKPIKNIIPPPMGNLYEYFKERKIKDFTPKYFYDTYEARGWMIGKNKMKDWQATVRTWEEKKDFNKKPSQHVEYEDLNGFLKEASKGASNG